MLSIPWNQLTYFSFIQKLNLQLKLRTYFVVLCHRLNSTDVSAFKIFAWYKSGKIGIKKTRLSKSEGKY